jgi:signal transduction histidine kinase
LLKASRTLLGRIQKKPDEIARETFELETVNGKLDIEAMVLPVGEDVGDGRLIVVRDVTKEKSIERFRWETINHVVHDLRSPLSAVISSLQLAGDLVAMRDYGELDQVTGIALINSRDMLDKVNSILEIARMETEHIELKLDVWALKPIVGKAIAAIGQLASDAEIQVLDCVPSGLPPLEMDESLMRRVLVNLLDNALRHTPSGGQIRIEAVLSVDNRFAEIAVVDTGKGIPPELREDIFEKFFRVEKSALRGRLGFGLGLTFCKLTVEAHGGRIWVQDGPEGGAAFWFTLPVAQTERAN